MVINPKYWNEGDKLYGQPKIARLIEYFSKPLELLEFEKSSIVNEWKLFRSLVKNWYSKFEVHSLWAAMFKHRENEFPNLCKLVSVIMSISSSNATVERGFSDLTNILTDRRLCLNHKSMRMMLLIKINNYSWNEIEKEEIIKKATDVYLEKRRFVQLAQPVQEVSPASVSSLLLLH